LWTIGHSTRALEEFIGMLDRHAIKAVADVRRFPASRKYPQFNREQLEPQLATEGIEYLWLPELGGRRRPRQDSHNTVWRNTSFRGYADYMETEAFQDGIGQLLRTARHKPTALMCAEAVWWRCHRALIADALKAAGIEVIHILSATNISLHPYTSAARIVDGKLSYAGAADLRKEGTEPSE
jgi:uncharacterized protein (DUF488 family)